jgi:hypothetical protein
MADLRNHWVHFKIRDIYHPDPTQVLFDLHGNDLLTGRVIDLSNSGLHKDAFVVVEVQGMAEPVIVPVDRILASLQDEHEREPTQ